MSEIPLSANNIINIDDLKSSGKPSSNLNQPNYNQMINLFGDAYNMGYQHGKLLGQYIEDAVKWSILSQLQFISNTSIDEFTENRLIDILVLINTWLYCSFYSKMIPDLYQVEAMAIVEGAHDAGYTNITIGHISIINFMSDLVNSLVNLSYKYSISDQLKSLINDENFKNLNQRQKNNLEWFFTNFGITFILEHDGCDAYTTSNKENSIKHRYFTRFLQFPSIDYLFYDIVYPFTRIPNDGRLKTIGWILPGLIASYTSMNEYSVCTSINYCRSEAVDIKNSGLSTIMVLRIISDYAKNTNEAVVILRENKRGCPYFISIFDGQEAVVCEIFGSSVDLENPKDYIVDNNIRDMLPRTTHLLHNSPKIENNVITRKPSFYIDKHLFTDVNSDLFEYFGIYKPISNISSGNIYPSWQSEQASYKLIGNNYYLMPINLKRNLIVQTNNCVTPIGRTLQMGTKSNFLVEHAEAITWRYYTLSKLIENADGDSVDDTLLIPNYISPFTNPLYPSNSPYTKKGIPLGLIPVQCCITVYNPYKLKVYMKAGPWQNSWIEFSLFSSIK